MKTDSNLLYIAISMFVDLILPVTTGFLIRYITAVRTEIIDRLMLIQLYILLPVTTALTFWGVNLSAALIGLPLTGVVMILLPGAVGLMYLRFKFQDPLEQGSYLMSVMLSNRGVVGAISLFILFGEMGYAYAQLTMMLAPLIIYLFCFPLAQYFGHIGNFKNKYRISFRALLLNPRQLPLLGIVIGLILKLFDIIRPEEIGVALPFLIHIGAWFFLVPVGHLFNPIQIRRYILKMWDVLIIRHIVTPIIIAFVGYLTGYRGIILSCIIILSGSPVAINAVVISKIFGLKTDLALSGFILSTSVYLICVFPLYYLLVRHLLF